MIHLKHRPQTLVTKRSHLVVDMIQDVDEHLLSYVVDMLHDYLEPAARSPASAGDVHDAVCDLLVQLTITEMTATGAAMVLNHEYAIVLCAGELRHCW